ncbi:MAG: DUF4416 family protein [Deltaproteobacteria bacterium]|nr:DUF4416 family protein [Deltaproteobacteria bacterium]
MGEVVLPEKALLLCAVFSRYEAALDWCKQRLVERFGDVCLESEGFDFCETRYYESQMGAGLRVCLLAFSVLIDSSELAEVKLKTNLLEKEYSALRVHPEGRPLNIDPGYLTPAKFVLATTKDASHRIYLGKGIFAEITLHYSHGAWQDHAWTYPNYRRLDYKAFLEQCRMIVVKGRANNKVD